MLDSSSGLSFLYFYTCRSITHVHCTHCIVSPGEVTSVACENARAMADLPDITIHVPTTTSFSILFPGYIEDIDQARSMLPTEDKLASAYQTHSSPVILNLRPDDVYAHPLTARRHNQNLLILKIQQHPNDGGMDVDGVPANVSVEAVAHCSTCYEFDGMADFQYLPYDTRPPEVRYGCC